jgi:hypothetical protein
MLRKDFSRVSIRVRIKLMVRGQRLGLERTSRLKRGRGGGVI